MGNSKARTAINAAYEERRPLAIANLERIRKENKKATPTDALEILELELNDEELVEGTNSEEYSSLVTLSVLTALEIYGGEAVSEKKQQALINMFMVADAKRLLVMG